MPQVYNLLSMSFWIVNSVDKDRDERPENNTNMDKMDQFVEVI